MTVKELITQLETYDPNHTVVVTVGLENGDTDHAKPVLQFWGGCFVVIYPE